MKPRCTPWYRAHSWPRWSAPSDTTATIDGRRAHQVAVVHRTCERCGYFWMREVG